MLICKISFRYQTIHCYVVLSRSYSNNLPNGVRCRPTVYSLVCVAVYLTSYLLGQKQVMGIDPTPNPVHSPHLPFLPIQEHGSYKQSISCLIINLELSYLCIGILLKK
jgi:hypothetical protein